MAMISGGPIRFEEDNDEVNFTLAVLRDGAHLEWEEGQYKKRKRVVRGMLVGCTSEVWKNKEWGLMSSSSGQPPPKDPLFAKKGWNKIDSGFRLWGG